MERQHTLLGLVSISSLILLPQGGGLFLLVPTFMSAATRQIDYSSNVELLESSNAYNALKRINCVGLMLTKCIELSQHLVQA